MPGLVDLNCHLLAAVDDGPATKEESAMLLAMLYRQGVRTICVTPAFSLDFSDVSDRTVRKEFDLLKERAFRWGESLTLFLSREYRCDRLFYERLSEEGVRPLGKGRGLLLRFEREEPWERIGEHVDRVTAAGYLPVIAHAEEYTALREDEARVEALSRKGAKILLDAGGILGRYGKDAAGFCQALIRDRLADAVASNAHDLKKLPPEMEECRKYLCAKAGEEYAALLTEENPLRILSGDA